MMKQNPPLVPEIGIIALVYHKWGFPWMTPHHVLPRLSEYFHVVWMNPPHGWRQIPERLRRPAADLTGTKVPPGFTVYTPPFWLPTLHRPESLARYTFGARLRQARSILLGRGCQRIVLYLWHPQFRKALSAVPFDLSCYHIDDEYSFSTEESPIDKEEKELIASVGQVFAISPALLEKKGKINPHTAFAPEGVDYDAYATPVAPPADIAQIPHPRVGYTGVLKKQLDWALLCQLATRHPEWSFVFVGPQAPHPEIAGFIRELSALKNVYFLGAKSVEALTAYPQHFDVCVMPYHLNDYTKYIYPLKLHEYLASGRPVVGAPIRSLQEFGSVISLARSTEEWSRVLNGSLAPAASSSEQVEARRRVARQYDWKTLVYHLAHKISDRLGPVHRDRLERILGEDHGVDAKRAGRGQRPTIAKPPA